jgi:hypothetical protein
MPQRDQRQVFEVTEQIQVRAAPVVTPIARQLR